MPIEQKKIDSSDLLDLNTYSKERKAIRKEVVAMKKNRRVELGPHSTCLLYTSPSPRDRQKSRMPSSA